MARYPKRIAKSRKVAIIYEHMYKCGHTEQFSIRVPVTKRGMALMKQAAARRATQLCFICE